MYCIKTTLATLCLLFWSSEIQSQSYFQTFRGTIIDNESKIPLIGATVKLLSSNTTTGATTDVDGSFKIENIPVGRHNFEISYLGYETTTLSNLQLSSGKELVLEIALEESSVLIATVEISAESSIDKTKSLNEFATVSSRTFSVEETARYASSAFDPSRMAQNYAGVGVGSGDDLFNEIVVRGNSPSGVLWRLEGVEIPNPNHFGGLGNSGGAISMLSSSTLSNSDFYTGAFPAEFGNATSGVFDLNMRNGNNEKREYAFMLGALGLEFAAEGPINKDKGSSYLVNYRYSTLAMLEAAGLNPAGDVLPKYQDVSFKFNFPSKKYGNIALFGLGGSNEAAESPEADSLQWNRFSDREGFVEKAKVGTLGLSHRKLLSNNSYLRTVLVASYQDEKESEYFLDDNYESKTFEEDAINQSSYRLSSMYHQKLDAKNSFRIGGIYSYKDFGFDLDILDGQTLKRYFENNASTSFVQAFAQWKTKFNDQLTLNLGYHFSLLTLNNKMAHEPRLSLSYSLHPKHLVSGSIGLHSKMEALALYGFEGEIPQSDLVVVPKDNLGLTKSLHSIIGHDFKISSQLRIKTELYYQHLFDVPVNANPESNFSILNAFDVWDYFAIKEMNNNGTGRNIGVDMTIEKFFDRQYYFMLTGSLYDSKFTAGNGNTFNTRFNGNHQLNILGGKEFNLGKKANKTLGLNGKLIYAGGNRFTPINFEASQINQRESRYLDRLFESKAGAYYRLDVGMSYRINKKSTTHTIMLDIQNVTNRENPFSQEYDVGNNRIEISTQTGLFPFFNYRIEF